MGKFISMSRSIIVTPANNKDGFVVETIGNMYATTSDNVLIMRCRSTPTSPESIEVILVKGQDDYPDAKRKICRISVSSKFPGLIDRIYSDILHDIGYGDGIAYGSDFVDIDKVVYSSMDGYMSMNKKQKEWEEFNAGTESLKLSID